jgi:hypothetical protein
MKDPLIIDEEKKITKEDLKKEREIIKTQKEIDNLSYKDDPYLNSNCLSKLFFYWVFRIIRVKINLIHSFLKIKIFFKKLTIFYIKPQIFNNFSLKNSLSISNLFKLYKNSASEYNSIETRILRKNERCQFL